MTKALNNRAFVIDPYAPDDEGDTVKESADLTSGVPLPPPQDVRRVRSTFFKLDSKFPVSVQ